MIVRFCRTILLICLLWAVAAPALAQPETPPNSIIEGLVVGISEGDLITVNSFGTEIKVRLYGIATPQTAKVDKFTGWSKPGQPYAEEAFRALSLKVLHQMVRVDIRRTVVLQQDREQRQFALAVVYLDGRNINLEMVTEGWAWAYKKLITGPDFHAYLFAERRARARRVGLWNQDAPQPPWEFKPKLRVNPRHYSP